VGGVIIARQRPPTARGTAFIALEDEGLEASAAGVVNVILRPEVFAVVEGTLQWQGPGEQHGHPGRAPLYVATPGRPR